MFSIGPGQGVSGERHPSGISHLFMNWWSMIPSVFRMPVKAFNWLLYKFRLAAYSQYFRIMFTCSTVVYLVYLLMLWILKEENPSRKWKFESILGKDLSGFKVLGNHILNCGCFICWKKCLSYSVKKLDPCGWVRNFIFMLNILGSLENQTLGNRA